MSLKVNQKSIAGKRSLQYRPTHSDSNNSDRLIAEKYPYLAEIKLFSFS
ncbi:hypothetical protein D082_02130 [Synechocystis sp. PCC 6714]|nr:hypothetical protein D082_02130 [Synechocystis sp. PCC 6714]